MPWLKRLFSRLPSGPIPTTDFYFLAAVGDLVRPAGTVDAARPIEQHGLHLFTCGDCAVVTRYISDDELAVLQQREGGWDRIYYIVDDLLLAARDHRELPVDYRKRLATFASGRLERLLALKPIVVAPRQAILDQFSGRMIRCGELLSPSALTIAADFGHFDELRHGAPVRAAFLGTRSHQAGLAFLAEVLRLAIPKCPRLTVTLFQGRFLPKALQGLPYICNRRPLAWPDFRQLMARERFHLLLAPLPETPFNAGRSTTKILDAAAFGAAGLFSDREPFRSTITHARDGLVLPDDAAVWADTIRWLAEEPKQAASIAAGGAALARRIGDPAQARAFWLRRLGLTEASSTG